MTASTPLPAEELGTDELSAIVQEAYLYLYPLILMDLTRRQLTDTSSGNPIAGPANAFTHVRAFPPSDMRAVVRPNFDTLYSSAWLDLTGGPVVVSTQDTGGRYFLLPMLDMWTDVFAVPGKRTTGTGAASFALLPPGWTGDVPTGTTPIHAPTRYVWIIGRTQTDGPSDYPAVHRIQDGYTVTPSDGAAGARIGETPSAPGTDSSTEPLRQISSLPARQYFAYGAELMKLHAPHLTDWSLVARMKQIGLEPGASFDSGAVDDGLLSQGAVAAAKLMRDKMPTLARVVSGWQMNTDTMGVYGNYYLKRAIVAMAGLGANQPDDAIYPLNVCDGDGQPVVAENAYVLHFDRDRLPPANAFWSLTMYDAEGFQVANSLDRFAIGDRDALAFNADGSLDLYVQHEDPGAAKTSNWLPAPAAGALGLTLRLYAPRQEALDGRWNPPPINRVSA